MYSRKFLSHQKFVNFYKYSKYMGGAQVISKAPLGHYQKAPKIKDLIIWVNVVGPSGELRRLPAFQHDHLNTILNRHFTEGFYSECGGGDRVRKVSDDAFASSSKGVWCGSCQVIIADPWFGTMKPQITPIEFEVLERTAVAYTPYSRLACCVKLKPWMNEMIVTVPINSEHDSLEVTDNRFDDTVVGSGPSGKQSLV